MDYAELVAREWTPQKVLFQFVAAGDNKFKKRLRNATDYAVKDSQIRARYRGATKELDTREFFTMVRDRWPKRADVLHIPQRVSATARANIDWAGEPVSVSNNVEADIRRTG